MEWLTMLKNAYTSLVKPTADTANDATVADVLGIKADTVAGTSVISKLKQIAVEVTETEKHFHSNTNYLGLAAVPNAEIHRADVYSLAPFVLDAGDNAFGTAICVLGSGDTPVRAGNTKFDINRILITTTERTGEHILRWAWGASEAEALTAGDYSMEMFSTTATSKDTIITVQSRRITAGTKLWLNVKCASNTGTVNCYVGLHEYLV